VRYARKNPHAKRRTRSFWVKADPAAVFIAVDHSSAECVGSMRMRGPPASFKLASKVRASAKVTKRYHPPSAPHQRPLALDTVPSDVRARLRSVFEALDPLRLLD